MKAAITLYPVRFEGLFSRVSSATLEKLRNVGHSVLQDTRLGNDAK